MEPLIDRRRFLVGCLVGSGSLAFSLRARAAEARSLLTVWLEGGPSQLETWDPHPKLGGPLRDRSTSIPGLRISELFPSTAEQIHHLNVLRSLTSKEGDHERGTYFLKTGYRLDPTVVHPSLGALAAESAPASLTIPPHISLGPTQWPARGGFLGSPLDAFKILEPGTSASSLRRPVADPERNRRREESLEFFSRSFAVGRGARADRTLHQPTVDRALAMMSSAQLAAFDLDTEPSSVRVAYGDSVFGRGCLVARRLLEIGVPAIEVTLRGFDSHAANFDAHAENAKILDPALATLLRELAERELLRKTVVLVAGEFGRTPKINALEGRDHWPSGFSCLLGGAGLAAGVVLGATDPSGEKLLPEDPIPVADLAATVLTALGLDPSTEKLTPVGRPIALAAGTPVRRLLAT